MTRLMVDRMQSEHLLEMAQNRLMLKEHLVAHADLDIRDEEGRNALFWAIKTSHKHNTNLLLTYGSSLMVQPEHHALFHAIKYNDFGTFSLLLELGEDINMTNSDEQTLLMTAIKEENVMMVRYLINHGSNLYLHDVHGKTALEYATETKNQTIFELVHYKILYQKLQSKQVA